MSFRSITFKTVRDGALTDLNFAESAQTTEIKSKVTSYINTALDMAYPWLESGWPELRSAQSCAVTSQCIALSVITNARFGVSKFLSLSKNHPWKTSDIEPRSFTLTGDGITVDETVTDASLYVGYIEAPPVYDSTAWATSTAYAVGDVRFHTSDCYYCATAHTSGTFATDLAAAKWVILPFPAFLHIPVRTSVVAAMSGSGGLVETMEVLRATLERQLGQVAMRYEPARY